MVVGCKRQVRSILVPTTCVEKSHSFPQAYRQDKTSYYFMPEEKIVFFSCCAYIVLMLLPWKLDVEKREGGKGEIRDDIAVAENGPPAREIKSGLEKKFGRILLQ